MYINKLKALFNPERYHGWGKKRTYFEGWYYKIVNADETKAFAIIPGVAFGESGDSHSFIQVLDGKNLSAEYHKFSIDEFNADSDSFRVDLAGNIFSSDKIVLKLDNLNGELSFSGNVPWPSSYFSPGIMGPYSFVPFMECYHGILSMDHTISGKLIIRGREFDFTGGRGYMEKDWGKSFPSAYFWMQSNHFSKKGVSIKASVAKIPWLGSSFVGFIAGLYLDGKLIQFTTYNSSGILKSYADEEKVELTFDNKKYTLEIIAHRDHATELASPIQGFMDGRISESMTSQISLKLFDKDLKKVIFEDMGRNCGLEVAGEINDLFFP